MAKMKLFLVFTAAAVFSFPVAAKTYKWVDDQGVTHYGETIPPQYADKDRSELNKAGRVVKKKEVLTAEEKLEAKKAEADKRAEAEAAVEQKRRDKALVSTYSNPGEIDLARKRNLQQVEARINGIDSQLKMANGSQAGLQKEADGYKAAGKPIPPSLQEDMKATQERINKLQEEMSKAQASKAALNARYDADKARYKELTGK